MANDPPTLYRCALCGEDKTGKESWLIHVRQSGTLACIVCVLCAFRVAKRYVREKGPLGS